MDNNLEFKCNNNDGEGISKEIAKALNINFRKANYDGKEMAAISQKIKNYNKSAICTVPFSATIEGESLGSQVLFSSDNVPPRIGKYIVNHIEDIYKIKKANFNEGAMKAVLDAAKILSDSGEIVCVAIAGPFTVANELMDSSLLYKSLVREKEAMKHLFEIIEDEILEYIKMAVKSGASIISYADPAGTLDIVGPRVYNEFSGKISCDILKKSLVNLDNAIVHICGKTSCSLEKCNLASKQEIKLQSEMQYSEAIVYVLKNRKDIKLLGNGCIKRSNLKNLYEIKIYPQNFQ